MSPNSEDMEDENVGNEHIWNLPGPLSEELQHIRGGFQERSSRESSRSGGSISSDYMRSSILFSDDAMSESTKSPLFLLYETLEQRLTDIESFLLRTSSFIKKTNESNQPYGKYIPRAIMDPVCNPVWLESTEPLKSEIENMVLVNEEFKGFEFKYVLSNIRKWFRKRREELSFKLTSEFRRQYPTIQKGVKDDIKRIKKKILLDSFDEEFESIREKVDPDRSPEAFKKFARERILKYLDKSA